MTRTTISPFQLDNKEVSNTYVIDSWKDGVTLWVSSWIHWNERYWVQLWYDFLKSIRNNEIELVAWKIIWILIWNEKAFKENKRFLDDDLNRVVDKIPSEKKNDNYEQKRWNEIKNIIDSVKASAWLDLHSFSAPDGEPYIFAWLHWQKEASHLWVSDIAFRKYPYEHPTYLWVADYINQNGGIWFTFEAGNHTNHLCYESSKKILSNFLTSYGVIEQPFEWIVTKNQKEKRHILIEYKHIFTWWFRYKEGNPKSFDTYRKNELIGFDVIDWREKEVCAPFDGMIVLPKNPSICILWKEVFYFWRKI